MSDDFEPMSQEEGRAALRIIRLRRQLQDDFLGLTCAVCLAYPITPEGAVCACGGTTRLTHEAFEQLRYDNGSAYLGLLNDMSRAVGEALTRLGIG